MNSSATQRLMALEKRMDAVPPRGDSDRSFRAFVARVRPQYQWYRHCEVLADALQQVADGALKRLMVFMPPRHGKSECVSRLFPAYYLYRHPAHWVGVNSYAADLAYTFSRAARDNYSRAGGLVRDDAAAVKHWQTRQDGGLWAAGVGGPITGKGFHVGVIDDPIKNSEEAQSEVIRAKHTDWYESTFYTRAEPDAAIVIVQTRWHEDDLSGWLLRGEYETPDYWTIVNLPAIAEAQAAFPSTCTVIPDWREVGAALCPERYPLPELEKLQAKSDYFFSALYQQRPRPKDGGMFKRAWFELVGAAPKGNQRVRYWDLAHGDNSKNDYTCGVLMTRDAQGGFSVEDVVRGQWSAHERNQMILQTAALDRQRGSVRIWIEQPPGLAKESTDTVIKMLAGYPAFADKVMKDKVSRAEPFAAQCEARNVTLVVGTWGKAYLDELESFPFGSHDDQVDASSGAFNRLVEGVPFAAAVGGERPLANRYVVR